MINNMSEQKILRHKTQQHLKYHFSIRVQKEAHVEIQTLNINPKIQKYYDIKRNNRHLKYHFSIRVQKEAHVEIQTLNITPKIQR